MRDRNDIEELAHDTAGVDASPFMAEALTSVVDELMAGEKVRGLAWGLHSFVFDQPDLHELVAAMIIRDSDQGARDFRAEIERRLRRELEGSDVVTDRAAQMASESDEQS